MANCEKCGNSFTPSAERTEVTSLRILCPKCEAERRAEKAARATAAAAAQAGPRPGARPAAGTAPPSKVATAGRRAAGAGARQKSLATGVRGAEAKKLHGEASRKLFHKPVAGADKDQRGSDFHPDVQRELRILKQRESKAMTIAWIVCGVLVLAAGGFGMAAKLKRDADREAVEKYKQALTDFKSRMESFDVSTESGANEAIAFAAAETGINWEGDLHVGAAVTGVLSRARSFLDRKKDEREQNARLQSVESTLSDALSRSADQLSSARRTIGLLEDKGEGFGEEFASRVKAARAKVDRALLTRLYEEAKSLSTKAGEGGDRVKPALNAWTRVEDESTSMLDRVISRKDEEAKQYYTGEFRKIIEESNAFVSSVLTDEVIDRTPWTDLLNQAQKDNWQSYGLEGFRLENGTLEIAGPAPGSTANGLIAFPKLGWGYRDFTLEAEFVLDGGTVDFLFRLGKRVDSTVEYYTVSTVGQQPLKPGVTYRLEASYIGSQLTVTLSPADATDLSLESNWTKQRRGAFGAQVHEGAQLKITRLRIRELRNA